jgi:multidrug efflux pump subunit AcrA (membrane-fusion protein)
MLLKARSFARKHKVLSGFIIIAIAIIGYAIYKATKPIAPSMYVLAAVQRETLVLSITGTGQVAATNEIQVKPKSSGDVVGVYVKNGQQVRRGQTLIQLDSHQAQKAVRDAEANLISAQLALQKMKQPADALSLLQAQNALTQAWESKTTAEDSLNKAREDGFNKVANAFLDLPAVVSGISNILYASSPELGGTTSQWNIDYYGSAGQNPADVTRARNLRESTNDAYQSAQDAFNVSFDSYRATDRTASAEATDALIKQAYNATQLISDAVKDAANLVQFYRDQFAPGGSATAAAISATHLANLNSYTGTVNSHLSNLLDTT